MSGGNGAGYQVTTSELHAHVTSVQQVANTLGQALSAAEQVTVGVGAYGMICGPLFVPIVLAVSAPGLVTLGLAQQAVNSIAEGVRATAAGYESVEQGNKGSFTTLDGGV
jgi:uncharacterized protein YukE